MGSTPVSPQCAGGEFDAAVPGAAVCTGRAFGAGTCVPGVLPCGNVPSPPVVRKRRVFGDALSRIPAQGGHHAMPVRTSFAATPYRRRRKSALSARPLHPVPSRGAAGAQTDRKLVRPEENRSSPGAAERPACFSGGPAGRDAAMKTSGFPACTRAACCSSRMPGAGERPAFPQRKGGYRAMRRVPAAMSAQPAAAFSVSSSCRKTTAMTMVNTMLVLSMGATFATSPI